MGNKYIEPEDVEWLLSMIKDRTEHRNGRSTKWDIFRGSYDVWESADDGKRYSEIMDHRLNEARNLGLIANESGAEQWLGNENWKLTEAGEKRLLERNSPHE